MHRLLLNAASLAVLLLTLTFPAQAQVSIPGTEPVVIDFDGFTGAGFTPDPVDGQLNSDIFAVTGLSDGDLDFGGTATAGDFARGEAAGTVTTGGIYAGNPDVEDTPWLFVQSTGSDFEPGTLTIRYVNASGQAITELDIAYDIKVFNDQGRSNSWDFSYSVDNQIYLDIESLDYNSPLEADDAPEWGTVARSVTIDELNVPNGGSFYIRFVSDEVGGSGSRDQVGVDNIVVSATLEAAGAFVRFGADAETITEGDTYGLVVELINADTESAIATIMTTCDDATPTLEGAAELNAGNPSETIMITATNDELEEETEECIYILSVDPQNGSVEVGEPSTFTLTILDNDAAPLPDNALIITEFMADPTTPNDIGEWVEVFNNTGSDINLDGYTLRDATGNTGELGGVVVPSGGFVVLCFNGDTASNGGVTCDFDYASFTLNNTGGDDIILEDSDGALVDSLRYTTAWFASGRSTVYVGSPNGDNSEAGNWVASAAREGNFDDPPLDVEMPPPYSALGDDGSPGTNGVHGNLASPFGVGISGYCYAQATGDWSNQTTWANCPNGIPSVGDAAAILSPFTVTVDEATTVGVVVVEAANGNFGSGTLIVQSQLDVDVLTVAGVAEVTGEGAEINIGVDLSVSGSLTTNDAVTLLSTSSRARRGSATHTNEFGSITGTLTAQRHYVDAPTAGGGSFRGIFPPLTGVQFTQLNDAFHTQGAEGSDHDGGTPTLYTFDVINQEFVPVTDFNQEFDPNEGYVFYVFDGDIPTTWEVTGTVRGEYELALDFNPAQPDSGYNWVPQPFAGPIDFKELYLLSDQLSPDALNATLYVLDPASEQFRTYNAVSGVGADTTDIGSEPKTGGAGRYIAPFQSFVVQAIGPDAMLDYEYQTKDTGESPLLVGREDFARTSTDEVASHVRLKLAGQGPAEGLGSAQTYLVFYPGGEEGYDHGDAGVLYPFASEYATLVLHDESGRELSMDARSLALSTETFRVRVAATEPGRYTLSWPVLHEIPAGWSLTLLDTATGEEVDLRAQPDYTFDVAGATAARRGPMLGPLRPAQHDDEARFLVTVSATATAGGPADAVPHAFVLESVYPNPFATTATVRYALPHAADVRLTVYDLLGREVATLAEGSREAGRHSATVSASGLAGGVYLVRMTTDGYAETKKIVVLR